MSEQENPNGAPLMGQPTGQPKIVARIVIELDHAGSLHVTGELPGHLIGLGMLARAAHVVQKQADVEEAKTAATRVLPASANPALDAGLRRLMHGGR